MKEIDELRRKYPAGTRIRLDSMEDPQAIQSGSTGAVDFVDDAGQIHMKWDNGRSLAIIPGVDQFTVIARICPKCGKEYTEYPALSREDNKTDICPECGTLEALQAFAKAKEKGDA